MDLSPLAQAVLNKSEEDLSSIIASHPHSVRERIYGATVLHLSCRWPVGLCILLSAGAAELVDEPYRNSSFNDCTAVDLAIYFSCVEAVSLLFDAGCSWNGFEPGLRLEAVSLRCVRLVACLLGARRRHLLRLAEEKLTESQLSAIGHGNGVLDARASHVVTLLLDAAVELPAYLTIPDGYETIYLSGSLDITYFPVFYEYGFHDRNNAADVHYAPIQTARWAVWASNREDVVKDLFTSDLVERLENYGFLDIAPSDVQSLGVEVSATGHHILGACMTAVASTIMLIREVTGYPELSLPVAPIMDVLTCQTADCCRCACSSSAGCVPLTISLKVAANTGWPLLPLWERVWDELAGELLRFLTFEALEMTHTCCTYRRYYHTKPARYCGVLVDTLWAFQGSIDEIQDEEDEMHALLERLLPEFDAELAESGAGLRNFVWGYWRRRMAEEFVPELDEGQAVWHELGVKLEQKCELPYLQEKYLAPRKGENVANDSARRDPR